MTPPPETAAIVSLLRETADILTTNPHQMPILVQRLRAAADALAAPPQEGDTVLRKARKLIEALAEPCETSPKKTDHEWRKCRRCIAATEFDQERPAVQEMLRAILNALPIG